MAKSLYTQLGELRGAEISDQSSFTHQFTPPSEELKTSRGSLYTLVTLQGETNEKRREIEKEIYQTFQSTYYSSSVGSNLSALEEALDEVEKYISDKSLTSGTSVQVDLVAAVLWGEALYLVKTQNPAVLFQRGNVVKTLRFNKGASGVVKHGDSVILVNQKFLENIGSEALMPEINDTDLQESIKKLNEKVSQKEGTRALVLRIYVEEPKQEALEMIELGGGKKGWPAKIFEDQKRAILKIVPVLQERLGKMFLAIKKTTVELFHWALNKILEPWKTREPGHLEDPVKRRRARTVQIALILIILLSLSIGGALVRKSNSQKAANLSEKVKIIESTLNEAEALVAVNPEKSKSLLTMAEKLLLEVKKLGIEEKKLSDIEKRAAALNKDIRKVYEVSLNEFYSFGQETKIQDLIQTQGELIVFDKDKSKVFLVDKASKDQSEIYSGSGVNTIALYENDLYLQSDKGVEKLDIGNRKQASLLGSTSLWGKVVGAGTYQGNLYLLDEGKRQVWKYLSTGGGLSSAAPYFKGGKPSLGTLSAMTVDGSIWLGNKEGEIFKFLGGKDEKFEINDLDKPFGEIADIYTAVESSILFILDKSNGRVVLLKKDGEYLSQYTSPELTNAGSFVVDEKDKKVFVGIGSTIKNFSFK